MKNKSNNLKYGLIVVLCAIIVVPAAGILLIRMEGEDPSIGLSLSAEAIGISQTISVSISDKKSGLRRVWIGLMQGGKEVELVDRSFPGGGILKGGSVHTLPALKVKIEPGRSGLSDGKAVLRMAVWDYSWRGWWRGNKTYLEKTVQIDTKAPEIEVYSRFHNINQGGSGLVIYRISESCPRSGVLVEEGFFPGYSGYFSDPKMMMAFFGLNHDQGPGAKVVVEAVDKAGNRSTAGFYVHIRAQKFKSDVINVSDRFLETKMPEFDDRGATDANRSGIEKFIRVNRDVRKSSYAEIFELTTKTDSTIHWKGPFLRLPGSVRRAGFADRREYKYQSRTIDHQVHLGVDLASVRRAPAPVANSGKVVFVGRIGIYGKTVVIDHGFGLFSSYSHLSGFEVRKGQMVSKGDIIGRTGSTGLAGGDHLHFSMAVHNIPVNPIEWWDASWIKNNITDKMDAVASGLKETEAKGGQG